MSGNSLCLEVFGLIERPFSPLPDPDFLFWSRGHRRAFTMLQYALTSDAPLVLLTGDPGTGKSMLAEHLLRTLPGNASAGRVPAVPQGQGTILPLVLGALPGEADLTGPPAAVLARLSKAVGSDSQEGRRTLVVFDEAQALSIDALEELRGLGNLNHGKEPVLQILLTGQPELRRRLSQPGLHAFAQQAADAGHLGPLTPDEVAAYIRHRLHIAGGRGGEFTQGAVALATRHAAGVPRRINRLCDLALIYAASAGAREVTAATMGEVLSDTGFGGSLAPVMEAAE